MPETGFSPIADTTRRAEIVALIKRAVLTGQLEPGQKVNELRIAEQMRVSRAPLREAIRELVQQGLLVSIPYAGTMVIDVTAKDIEDAYSLNKVLDEFAIERTWPNRSGQFFDELDRRHQAVKACDARQGHDEADRDGARIARADPRMGRQFDASGDVAAAREPAADVFRAAPARAQRAGSGRGSA